jgi:hypothetical protein
MTKWLAAFLAARLDEDEKAARSALGWQEAGSAVYVAIYASSWQALNGYRPDRVLRDVEAKRAILAEHGPANGGRDADRCRVCTAITHTGVGHTDARRFRAPCPTLLFLAAVYSDHPDYRQEWAVSPLG